MWVVCPQRDVFPGCICHLSPSQSGAAPKEIGDLTRRSVSGRAGPTEFPAKVYFLLFFSPVFPKEGHGMRQLSWEMSQCCLLLQGLAAFAARVTVSDTSCHFQCSLLVPESVPAILPQERLLHSLMKRGNNSKANLIHHTWVREIKSQTTNLTVEVCLEIF